MDTSLFKRTARLFARPSFIEGFARAIDIGSTMNEYNKNQTPEEADSKAIQSDWKAVGDDIYFALESCQTK